MAQELLRLLAEAQNSKNADCRRLQALVAKQVAELLAWRLAEHSPDTQGQQGQDPVAGGLRSPPKRISGTGAHRRTQAEAGGSRSEAPISKSDGLSILNPSQRGGRRKRD